MLIVYDSMTGNVQRFIEKLGMRNIKIYDGLVVDEPFVLVTYTTGFGQIPKTTDRFLIDNHPMMQGVICSGNKNWNTNYGLAGDKISKQFSVPLLFKFEISGQPSDIIKAKKEIANIEIY